MFDPKESRIDVVVPKNLTNIGSTIPDKMNPIIDNFIENMQML